MGAVYRARDPRLGRDVAIKVLPAAFSSDRDRLQRFEQEARTVAALSHPNIVALFDIGEFDGAPFIVSELLEGETLRARLDDGSLSVRKAIDSAVQIAHGLSAAHEKGIVHRDLKPENIFVTGGGRVKILDFGLAKLTEKDAVAAGLTTLPTTPPATQPGTVLGTAGYMAPEQVRGLVADHRADIFSFGAVLYEMLSGCRAFKGDTAMDTITAILKEEPPDPPAAESPIPPALMRIVHRCLEKNPVARFQTATDLAFALEGLSIRSGSEPAMTNVAVASPMRRRAIREGLAWGLALAGIASAAFLAWRNPRAGAIMDPPRVQFTIPPPSRTTFSIANTVTPFPSPDGRMVAFMAPVNGANTLWLRPFDSPESRPIASTERPLPGGSLFWSPDSRYVGFFTAMGMKKVDVSQVAAPAQTIWAGEAFNGPTAAWGRDGTIVFAETTSGRSLSRVSANGGPVAPATTLDASRNETSHRVLQFLPDGRHFLYQSLPGGATVAGSLDGEPPKEIVVAESKGLYSAGHLLFIRQATLMAQPFDVGRLELTGDAVAVANGIQTSSTNGVAAFAVSEGGVLAYRADVSRSFRFAWFDRAGRRIAQVGEEALWGQFSLSPDGRFVAAQRSESFGGNRDIWLLDIARGVSSRLTTDPVSEGDPIWSPDGRFVAFTIAARGVESIYRKDVASGEETVLMDSKTGAFSEDWSPDNRWLAYGTRSMLRMLSFADPQRSLTWLDDRFLKDEPHFSPDGRWIAFESTESGQYDVYIAPFPGPGQKVRVSTAGGGEPRWRRDGKEIFYLTQDGMLMSAAVSTVGSAMAPAVPQALFKTPIAAIELTLDQYAVTGDGQRFLIQVPSDATEAPLTIVLNWASGLHASSSARAR